jgi:phosphohistidine phosphatase
MRTLTIIRHAKSSWDNPELQDFDRPLNHRGLRDAPRMGRILKEKLPEIELMISSPAQRAMTTATLLADELGYPTERIEEDRRLYEASVATLQEIIEGLDNSVGHVALVAHNPGLESLAGHLGADIAHLPTCAAVTLKFAVDDWRAVDRDGGSLLAFEYPKKYR